MSVAIDQDDPIYLDVQALRNEYGWPEVARGLTKILMGYVYLILGFATMGGVLGFTIAHLMKRPNDKNAMLYFEIACMVSLGAAFLLCGACYGMIVVGQWKCLKNAPERHGAKWMMFACFTCLFMGPAINIACSAGGVQRQPEFRKGPRGFQMPKFDRTAQYMQMASAGIGLTGFVLFMAFLRAVALCFNDRGRAAHVLIYLIFFGTLWAGTYYVVFREPGLMAQPPILLALGAGWVLSFLWHLLLILLVRLSIGYRLQLLRSPLEM